MAFSYKLEELSFRRAFWAAALVTAALWLIPYGEWVIYPLSLLGTWAHELGHGLAALLAGGSFQELQLHADLSGVAVHTASGGGFTQAFVAAGGLLGPALVGFAMLLLSSSQRLGNLVLFAVMAALVLTVVLWVRNLFGIVALSAVAVGIGASLWTISGRLRFFLAVLMGIQIGLSGLRNWRYLFTATAWKGQPSDTGLMAQGLGGSAWLWGAVILALDLGLLFLAYKLVRNRIHEEIEKYA